MSVPSVSTDGTLFCKKNAEDDVLSTQNLQYYLNY
jgi:hypothetical protein